jgi:phage I-like protein
MTKKYSHRILDGIPLSDISIETDQPTWHQIALSGEWKGHWMGVFALSEKTFSDIVSSHQNKKIATVVDYDHSSVFGGSSRAAGWVEALEPRGGELHAAIKWTDAAKQAIAAGEYRYLSPTITLKTKNRVTGEEGPPALHSVALTNVPFLHELPSVQLSNLLIDEEENMNELQVLVCAQLGLPPESGAEQIKAALIALQDPARSTEAVKALRDELNAMKAEASKRDASAAVERAFSEGKLVESQREWALNYACSSPEGFAQWASSAPATVPMKKVERSPEVAKQTSSVVALSDEQKKINAILGISDEDFLKFNEVK